MTIKKLIGKRNSIKICEQCSKKTKYVVASMQRGEKMLYFCQPECYYKYTSKHRKYIQRTYSSWREILREIKVDNEKKIGLVRKAYNKTDKKLRRYQMRESKRESYANLKHNNFVFWGLMEDLSYVFDTIEPTEKRKR